MRLDIAYICKNRCSCCKSVQSYLNLKNHIHWEYPVMFLFGLHQFRKSEDEARRDWLRMLKRGFSHYYPIADIWPLCWSNFCSPRDFIGSRTFLMTWVWKIFRQIIIELAHSSFEENLIMSSLEKGYTVSTNKILRMANWVKKTLIWVSQWLILNLACIFWLSSTKAIEVLIKLTLCSTL